MPARFDRNAVRSHLEHFALRSLFIEELGWDHGGADAEATVGGRTFALHAIAHKRGMVVYRYVAESAAAFPNHPTRQKIERIVARTVREHLIVYATHDRSTQYWQWVKREPGRPDRPCTHLYSREQAGEALIQKLEQLVFTLDEEENLTLVDVTSRASAAFDVEKVTKGFYDRFKKEHNAFLTFIDGITNVADREWYASLMLNRMMFIYFIQKRGFLDNDTNYLRKRLYKVRQQRGNGNFHSFYRLFLLRLFHEGLGQPEAVRAPDLAALLGQVPYLNGGLFDVHDLERDNPDIRIPDEAFEQIFAFFDAYSWHLDDRPLRKDNEINPDVLGYIFEKYINQKQMGAYYTKEDITGYISRNTVLPCLFDRAKKDCSIAFKPGGGVWRLLADDPDRYVYGAVRHGITYDVHQQKALPEKRDLPTEVAAGLDDVAQRGGWNEAAPSAYALPTETWREHVARRQRYEEIYAKLKAGEVTSVNDLITSNLDVETFAQDVIAGSEGPELVRAFWKALNAVSILDPTCGSGAFLFAALNVLEPLYTACLDAMRGFLDDLDRSQRKHRPEKLSDFRKVLEQIDKHASERYFILKSIIINNLYGVDIMEEAVDICKLRLFLKLVAQLDSYDQIEPLPDIDFNVRAGNTLVGFTSLDEIRKAFTMTVGGQRRMLYAEDEEQLRRIEEEAELADRAFHQFRAMQTKRGMDAGAFAGAKSDLRKRLDDLRNELDEYLSGDYGVKTDDTAAYQQWRDSHQPFHWFVEFYGIMHRGGFDVVIGNPPYVNCKSLEYVVQSPKSLKFPDIYGYVVMQSHRITNQRGRCGVIIPLSATFSFEFSALREQLTKRGTHWFSSFDNIPASLFFGVSQRCTIWLSTSTDGDSFATRLFRWRSAYRTFLLDNVTYNKVANGVSAENFGIPRLADRSCAKLLALHIKSSCSKSISPLGADDATIKLGFSPTARNFISTYIEQPPVLHGDGERLLDPAQCGWVTLPSDEQAFAAFAITAGDACFWYWLTRGDGFHVTNRLLTDLLAPIASFPKNHLRRLATLGKLLHQHRYSALVFKKNAGKYVGNFNYQKLLALTRRADIVFLSGLGAGWTESMELFSFISMVRSINHESGEKNIPPSLRERFLPPIPTDLSVDGRLYEIDKWISTTFSIEPEHIGKI